ncbi:MAG: hypothetical protein K2X49_11500 [Acetobacteraceae bacterium]|nr:hypothetical protein [Acetobacteraceae bacterium]
MSGGGGSAGVLSILRQCQTDFARNPDAATLDLMRRVLSNPAFAAAVRREVAGINDADVLAELIRITHELRDGFGDRASRREAEAKVVEIFGLTGGIGLPVGSIVAVLTMTTMALFAAVPAALGGLIAYQGRKYYLQLMEERHLYMKLEMAMDSIISDLP